MIENYSFGSITIDGKSYRSDLIIYPDHIDDSWWRVEGHKLCLKDIDSAMKAAKEQPPIVAPTLTDVRNALRRGETGG